MAIFLLLLFFILAPYAFHLIATFCCRIALKKKVPFFTPFTMIPIFNWATMLMYVGVAYRLMEIRSVKSAVYSSIDKKL
jgi:hypothetical protein